VEREESEKRAAEEGCCWAANLVKCENDKKHDELRSE
jgi:hypothetical protein